MKKNSNNKNFLLITGSLFGLVAVLHLIRAIFQWPLVVGNFYVPMFWSWYFVVTSIFFSFVSFSLVNKVK